MLSGYDYLTVGVLKTTIKVPIYWKGHLKSASIGDHSFSLGGLRFHLYIQRRSSNITPFALTVKLDSNSAECLAKDWNIRLSCLVNRVNWKKHRSSHETSILLKDDCRDFAVTEFSFDMETIYTEWEVEQLDIHPYRRFFVSRELARMKGSDCAILVAGKEDPLYAHRFILARDSPFFMKLFFKSQHYEGDPDGAPVTVYLNANEEELLEYLYQVYSPKRPLAFKRILPILRYASRFRNQSLVAACVNFLQKYHPRHGGETAMIKRWASEYDLSALHFRHH